MGMIYVYEHGNCGGKSLAGKFDPDAADAFPTLRENPLVRQTVYRTKSGRWFRRDHQERPGVKDDYRVMHDGQAQLWLACNGYPQERADLWAKGCHVGPDLDRAAKLQEKYEPFLPEEYLERMASILERRGYRVDAP